MRIFRVVDEQGFGYRRRDDNEQCLNSKIDNEACLPFPENYEEIRPLPEDDGIPSYPEHYLFAFQSIDLLKSWFSLHERNAGTVMGGQIMVIDVPDQYVILGRKQCCFDSGMSTLVSCNTMNGFDTPEDQATPYPKWD